MSTGFDQVVGWAKHHPLPSPEQVTELRRGGSASHEALRTGITAGVPIVTSVLANVLLGLAFTSSCSRTETVCGAGSTDSLAGGNRHEIAHGSWAALVGYVRGTAMVATFDATFIALGFWAQNGTW